MALAAVVLPVPVLASESESGADLVALSAGTLAGLGAGTRPGEGRRNRPPGITPHDHDSDATAAEHIYAV